MVVIFGASDDLCELRGAINDEVGAYNSVTLLIKDGKLLPPIEPDDIDILKKYGVLAAAKKSREHATQVIALWCKTHGWSWTIETDAPPPRSKSWRMTTDFAAG